MLVGLLGGRLYVQIYYAIQHPTGHEHVDDV
jgi:hypothetical protein